MRPAAGEDLRRAVAAVDLGGTKTTAALVSSEGTVLHRLTAPTPARSGPDPVLDAVVELLDSLAASAPGLRIEAVGVGTAGVVDVDSGSVLSATDAIPGWAGTSISGGLSSRLLTRWGRVVPLHVQNDVDAHGAGEAWCGAGTGAACVLMVTVGTGVGGSVVHHGEPRRGAHRAAGEIGHVPVPGAQNMPCGCGRTGHLEAVASGVAVGRRYSAEVGEGVDGREVAARAAGGDPVAAQVVSAAARGLGTALAGAITLLDPDVVVVGGGFAGAGDLWWEEVVRSARGELIPPLREVPIVPATLGEDAPLVGAARAASALLRKVQAVGA